MGPCFGRLVLHARPMVPADIGYCRFTAQSGDDLLQPRRDFHGIAGQLRRDLDAAVAEVRRLGPEHLAEFDLASLQPIGIVNGNG